ncbi:hypothetical protein ACFQV2_21175 [Actinokineospora soli]|uniref:Uncharacterized protein n=1 Tax=Actinokineospora soli TaxID=1048753 RepID=A0ABW2TPM4_9PSEU
MTYDEMADALEQHLPVAQAEADKMRGTTPLGYDIGEVANTMDRVIGHAQRALQLYRAGEVDGSLIESYARWYRLVA